MNKFVLGLKNRGPTLFLDLDSLAANVPQNGFHKKDIESAPSPNQPLIYGQRKCRHIAYIAQCRWYINANANARFK